MQPSTPYPSSDSFAAGDADTIRDALVQEVLLRHPDCDPSGAVFRARAVEMVGLLSPMMAWMRDQHGIPLTPRQCYAATDLRTVALLRHREVLSLWDGGPSPVRLVPAGPVPAEVARGLRSHLATMPGCDPDSGCDGPLPPQALAMHGYSQYYLSHVCRPAATAARG